MVATRDEDLEGILASVSGLDSLIKKYPEITPNEFSRIVMSPDVLMSTGRSSLIKYDTKTGEITGNFTYGTFAPIINDIHGINSEENGFIESERVITPLLENRSSGVTILDGRAASQANGGVDGTPGAGIELYVHGYIDPSRYKTHFRTGIHNDYEDQEISKKTSLFFNITENKNYGYGFDSETGFKYDADLNGLLDAALSPEKSTAVRSLIDSKRLFRLEASKKKYPDEFTPGDLKELEEQDKKIFGGCGDYKITTGRAYVNGMEVSLEDFIKDVDGTMKTTGITYLNNINPTVEDGKILYMSMSGEVRENLDSFIKKIKMLFNGDEKKAMKSITGSEEAGGRDIAGAGRKKQGSMYG